MAGWFDDLVANQSSLPRKLSSGVYGRLEFDFACNRGHGFGEAYLHGVLIEILAANVDPKQEHLRPSFPLPVLQKADKAAGRKREVDLVVVPRNDETDVRTCIEAKWAGSSHASVENVLHDLARLALVSEAYPEALCLFVLVGGKSPVEKLLNKGILAPHGGGKKSMRLLRHPYDGLPNSYYLNNVGGRHAILPHKLKSGLERKLPRVPDLVRTYLYKPSHLDPPDWSVQVWRVSRSS